MPEYTPTLDDLIESYASTGDGLGFKRAYFARLEAARELVAAHDAVVRADQAEVDARIVLEDHGHTHQIFWDDRNEIGERIRRAVVLTPTTKEPGDG